MALAGVGAADSVYGAVLHDVVGAQCGHHRALPGLGVVRGKVTLN